MVTLFYMLNRDELSMVVLLDLVILKMLIFIYFSQKYKFLIRCHEELNGWIVGTKSVPIKINYQQQGF